MAEDGVEREKKRGEIAKELLDTERTYVSNLSVLVQLYFYPLRSQGIVEEERLAHMFGNIEQLWSISSELLWALEERMQQWSPKQHLGDIFLNLVPSLQVYDDYYRNYDLAVETVDQEERQNPAFKQFLRELDQVGECEALTLGSRLILPIQRLPRYQLLLGALVSKTQDGHPDSESLHQAILGLQDTANRIDNNLKRMENRNKIYTIQSTLIACPLLASQPDRLFLKEGVVLKVSSSFAVNCTLFLFSDVLVYSHRSLKSFSQLRYKGMISLAQCCVRSLADTDEMKNAFQVLCPDKPLTLYTKTETDKEEWISAIGEAVDALLEAQPHLKDQRRSLKPPTATSTVPKPPGMWRMFREHSRFKRSSGDSSSPTGPKPAGDAPSSLPCERAAAADEGTTPGVREYSLVTGNGESTDSTRTASTEGPLHLLRRRSKTSSRRDVPHLSYPWADHPKPTKDDVSPPTQAKKKNRNLAITLKKLGIREGSQPGVTDCEDQALDRGRNDLNTSPTGSSPRGTPVSVPRVGHPPIIGCRSGFDLGRVTLTSIEEPHVHLRHMPPSPLANVVLLPELAPASVPAYLVIMLLDPTALSWQVKFEPNTRRQRRQQPRTLRDS